MGHEIGRRDTAMFSQKAAWHGLGVVIEEAPTPEEALAISGLNWEVGQDPIYRKRDGSLVKTHVENYRKDNGYPLGVVGAGYSVVQNEDLFRIAYGIADAGTDLRVESAFSMKDNRRVIVTIRADTFAPTPNDEVNMYLVTANGHDGSLVLINYFSSTRVVCNNTFQASLAAAKHSEGFIALRHEGDMESKIKQAQESLRAYTKTYARYREQVDSLVSRKMSKDEMDEFITDAIILMDGPIPKSEDAKTNKRAATKREKATESYRTIVHNFDAEAQFLKGDRNAWLAFNACTKWMQHQRDGRQSRDEQKRIDNRVFSDQFGQIAKAKGQLWKNALSLV
jgi:phage/plasmid-like protein (TIGR03299 family)